MKPYKESKNGNIIRRTFSHDVSESELVWHRDREDRIVLPLNENDWMVQFDNQLPTKLVVGEEYFIPKNVYHRVIKGNGDLMVEIIETNFDDDVYEIYEVIEEGKKKKKKKKKKKDACYHKVRARYDVWPSAYASGALVKCRKVGAANWGNSSNESEKPIEEKWSDDYKKSIDCKNPKGFSQKAHCDARKKRQRGEETKSKPVNENVSEISRIVNQYMKDTEYDIQNSLGNCSFFTKDVINWAKNNGIKADYVYMPMSEEYRKENNISDNEWEDHIVPMINGVIIDFAYTPQGVSKNVRTSNTIPPRVFKYSDNLFKPNGIYGKFGYTKPEINTEYGNPKNINSFDVVEPNKKKDDLDELFIYESIDKIAGVWDTNEKFDDGSDFKIKFKVSDIIELAKDLPVKNIDPKKIEYDFSGRQEDPTKTKDRVNNADLSYPIIVVKNENGKIFAMLDGTHRLEKALNLGLDKIKTKILNKHDLIQFKTDSLNEERQGLFNYLKQQLPNTPEYVIKDMIYRSIKTAHNAGDIDQEYIDQFKNIKWELKTNFPITMDIFTDRTKKELESRIGGTIKKDIPNDAERLQLQRDKLKSQGISKEPIILFKTKDGKYDLAEGKHRTIEAFKMFPEGFIQPNVYIGLNAEWLSEAKKTDFSKEKSQGLHGWFARRGGKGKSKGWVDCNTCRKDPETGRKKCKSCGRKEGEKRAKYPACRPTPSACGTRGKGKKWGKKTSNENLNVSENFSIFDKNYLKMKLNETFNREEPMVLPAEPVTKPKESPIVQPSRRNKPFLPERESQPDPKAEK